MGSGAPIRVLSAANTSASCRVNGVPIRRRCPRRRSNWPRWWLGGPTWGHDLRDRRRRRGRRRRRWYRQPLRLRRCHPRCRCRDRHRFGSGCWGERGCRWRPIDVVGTVTRRVVGVVCGRVIGPAGVIGLLTLPIVAAGQGRVRTRRDDHLRLRFGADGWGSAVGGEANAGIDNRVTATFTKCFRTISPSFEVDNSSVGCPRSPSQLVDGATTGPPAGRGPPVGSQLSGVHSGQPDRQDSCLTKIEGYWTLVLRPPVRAC